MAFAAFAEQGAVQLLQLSLERGRLGHGYLFSGSHIEELERVGLTLAKTLNCLQPPRLGAQGLPLDCCDQCLNCRKIDSFSHPDVWSIRPESKTRVITIDQMRELMQTINLKPTQSQFKVALIVGADRLNPQAANAFLKTLEEPPANSILLLLTTEPQRILETILSRCLRLNFSLGGSNKIDPTFLEWLQRFAEIAVADEGHILGRYRLLSALVARLNALKEEVAEGLSQRSPLAKHDDIEAKLRERWEEELEAAVESEYRRRRGELLGSLQWWFRDIWLLTQHIGQELLRYPSMEASTQGIAKRLDVSKANENLEILERTQRLLHTNVQEALALEVGLLQLKL